MNLLTIKQVAEHFGVCEQTVHRWVLAGHFPAPLRIGRRSIRWRREVVESFILDNEPKAEEVTQ